MLAAGSAFLHKEASCWWMPLMHAVLSCRGAIWHLGHVTGQIDAKTGRGNSLSRPACMLRQSGRCVAIAKL